ncbi:hypothetical protein DC094_08610 [Pelagibaculum spongiae]|uniref:Uncharacterized protein n=1 Tax=Pelagibaculum spongiae TaxID=2080658 RepID=A0A2V1GWB5_9GAMM|nr:hypothetical protein DC094_08610 [Pelagibaculum spongiae]
MVGSLSSGGSQIITADLITNIYGSLGFKLFVDGLMADQRTNNLQVLPVTGLCNTDFIPNC